MQVRYYVRERLLKIHQRLHGVEQQQEYEKLCSRFKRFGDGSIIVSPTLVLRPEFVEIGKNVSILSYCRIEAVKLYKPSNQVFDPVLKIGDGTTAEMFCHFAANRRVEIGNNVMIASHVFITDHLHQFDDLEIPVSQQHLSVGEVVIGDDSFIGEGAMILPNVHLGKHCVVGANAVVTKDFSDYSVIAGIPAKCLRQLV